MHFFYPGPAKLHPLVPQWTMEIFTEGLTSRNHRSPAIISCYQKAVAGLQEKLGVPADYTVLFTSSATECWEILSQSFPTDQLLHIFNGAFGEKWASISRKLGSAVQTLHYDCELPLPLAEDLPPSDWICLTHCETSNGTYLTANQIVSTRKLYPERLLALDATSSLGGIIIPWQAVDYVFASVQKCLGLPSGMAVLICSPRATARALQLDNKMHYNSLASSLPLAQQYQTTHTPNILGICLLMKLMENAAPIQEIHNRLQHQADEWYDWLVQNDFDLLIENAAVRSPTVICIRSSKEQIEQLKKSAESAGFVLGNGYGAWKDTTVRIANFPAIKTHEVMTLRNFLLTFHAANQHQQ
ncbi:aminotransferase class V-fold PLP-dependent enzyme [Rhodoflexus sp.]